MGDFNDDLLNYEADLLEDDILDENEDDLLLSDDDNTNAEALLSDSEDWINNEVTNKQKPSTADPNNTVSGSNEVVTENIRPDSPQESSGVEQIESQSEQRESTPPRRQKSPDLEEPSGSNEKTSGHSTVSSTPDKAPESDPICQSQESGISNTVDSTWVNTPEPSLGNSVEEVDSLISSNNLNKNNNEVSSTNEEVKNLQQEESKCVSSTIDSTPARSEISDSTEVTPAKSVSSEIVSSINDTPLTTSSSTVEREAETTETEDEERGERVNPKLSVEKQPEEEFIQAPKLPPHGKQSHPSGPNSFGGITPLYPPRPDFAYGPNRGPFPPPRPGFGPMRGPYFMPRPGFGPHPGGMRPGMHRPDMRPGYGDPMRPRPPMPMYGQMGGYPPNHLPPNLMSTYPGGMQPPPIGVIPKKVLINPNFKGGGLEAATSQLLKDTCARPLTDEELLRQQEEFITKNLMHVEKRRHESPPLRVRSRSRSPRSRSRSYSPQRKRRSREKDWKPYNNKQNWRRRNNDNWNKRRRFDEKEEEENPDDDDETKEYRRKVAEQKALREKMLRDKERRRRELAEEKKRLLQEEEDKRKKEEAVLKCKPVVVTKKIISLKAIKSSSDNEELNIKKSSQDSGLSSSGDGRKLLVKKSEDDSKTAVVKPLPKPISKSILDDIDEKLEAELLEESRTPSPPPPPVNTNRRVIIKSNSNTVKNEENDDQKGTKRVFDRLDRKATSAIGIDSAAKRKIQRLVSDKTK
uniref:CSON010700 protein n=1 Tax=Culicoides sonorensis TaxID=179676 RepID=A0A336LKR1_CULSO